MPDVSQFAFGRTAACKPVGYRSIFHFVDALPEAPATFDHTHGFNDFRMLGNGPDPSLTVNNGQPAGDCAFVGTVNAGLVDSIATGEKFVWPTSNEVVTEELRFDHGQDLGANLNQLLATWHSVGLPWSPKLPGYASLTYQDLDEFWVGVNAFTLAYIGIVVTQTMMNQTQAGEPWDLTGSASDNDVLGGHCVDVISRISIGGEVATWGMRQPFTTRWFKKNVEEAHILVTEQQVIKGSNGYGLDIAQLQASLDSLDIAA